MNQLIKLALLLHLLMDDMHYIHFNCRGRGFRNIHSLAKDYYEKLQNDFDEIVELCMSYGMQVPNPIKAAQLLQYLPLCSDKPFGYKESVALMQQRLCGLVNFLYQLHPEIEDINAKIRIEDLIKEWHKEVNFTLNRMMSEVCELEDDNGHTLLNRMPDFLFDAFRSLIDSKGIIPGYSLLSKFYPHNAKKIIIAFKSKDNFANDKEGGSGSSIDEDLEASLKELDEEVLNEIVEFMSDPSEEAVKKLSDEARKYLESLDEEHLKRLQELVSEGSDDGGSDSEGSGGDNSELDEKLKEELQKLDEAVLNEVVEFMSNPSEEALKNLSKEATEFLQGLDEEMLNRLQELAAGDGSSDSGDEDNKPSVEEIIEKKIAELTEEELEELRFILFDPKGEEGSGKDPELTKRVKQFIEEIGPENYELLKEKASVKSNENVENASVSEAPEDPDTAGSPDQQPQQPAEGQPAPDAGGNHQDLLDKFAALDEDTMIELQSIIKTGRGTGTNVKIERELMTELSALSEERLAQLTTMVEQTSDEVPHENAKVNQAPVQDPNKAPTNLESSPVKSEYEQKKMIYQSPENYRLDSAPGGRVSDTRGAQLAMNKVNQEKIQSFSNSNFGSHISQVYANIDRAVGEQLPKDVLDSISQAYTQSGPNGVAAVLVSRNIMPTKDMISQICSVLADMSPKENFEFSLPYRYSRMFR